MTLNSTTHSILVALPFVALAAPALAQDTAGGARDADEDRGLPQVSSDSPSGRFGIDGQMAVSSDAGLSLSNTSISGVDGSSTTILLRPAVDWFLADDFSLGGFVGLQYTSAAGGDSTVFSIGPRVGYNLPIHEVVSVWPKVGLSIASTSQSEDGDAPGDDDESNTSAQVNLFVPVMFHPVQHFFIGFGPALDTDLSGDAKATTIAARLTLGGWN